ICEGKTDYVYIKCAILSLAEQFPTLVSKDENQKNKLNVNLFKVSAQIERLLDFSGGSDQIKKLIHSYAKECAYFKTARTHNPVIVLIDNDQGASKIWS